MLELLNPDKQFIIKVDVSDYTTRAILSQEGTNGLLHPIVFISSMLSNTEQNYPVYDKEMLAIMRALNIWRYHLEGAKHVIRIITDHANL